MIRRVFALAALAGALLAPSARAQHLVAGADSLHPRLRFTDSLMSANDRCIVSLKKLNPKVRPVYVNGVPMGFC